LKLHEHGDFSWELYHGFSIMEGCEIPHQWRFLGWEHRNIMGMLLAGCWLLQVSIVTYRFNSNFLGGKPVEHDFWWGGSDPE
jgi:hypothetical protein